MTGSTAPNTSNGTSYSVAPAMNSNFNAVGNARIAWGQWVCPTCKHLIDTPQHELGCQGGRS